MKGLSMNNKAMGKRLVELRGNRSQETVARDNDLSLSAYTKYERGERIPRDKIKIRLAKYYGVSVTDIFFIEDDT